MELPTQAPSGKGKGKGVSLLAGALAQADAAMGKGSSPAFTGAGGKGGKGGKGDGGGGAGGKGGKGLGGGFGGGLAVADPRGPPGLFVKADWDCPSCGNTNWARRSSCNMCNTSKPNIATVTRAQMWQWSLRRVALRIWATDPARLPP